ncbi:NirD/YgiW/YdeI family stress tolerance protein [Alteromonas oceanisediminis]|uniref:NirD/YgiW/YdeI family stress tolerance protein n=1 Tax=Alteromonas oceanisediminis TaxID=2836180 RepID=UPI001BD94C5F|nr:NirD/YgiW/YdeI family stress tolerance protein [Alteromonas oceanisediminis]MBT0588104.1 NirD/YgiW/YdeI family stress tolerance protein [Alteromonas oceanisediminis]
MKFMKTSIAAAMLTALTAVSATGVVQANEHKKSDEMKSEHHQHLSMIDDDAWVTITGKVTKAEADGFMLDYGHGDIRIDLEDGNYTEATAEMIDGDSVTVTGQLDDDVFATRSIEASSVYVPRLMTTYISSSLDDESSDLYKFASRVPTNTSQLTVTGTVIAAEDEHIQLDVGENHLVVDLSELPIDVTSESSSFEVTEGDYVEVQVRFDPEIFGTYDIDATAITKIG